MISVCDLVAVFNGAGWSQKGAQYSEARYGKRDLSLLFPCYEKAAEMGSPEAEATVAYWRYMGFYCEQDRAEGERRFAALSSPEALLWGKYYRAYAEQHTGSKEKALLMRKELLDELPEGHRLRAHVYAAMGDALDIEDANHGSNLFLQQVKTIAAPTQTVPWVRDVGVRMVHMEERLCFRSGVRPGKRHLQDVERG